MGKVSLFGDTFSDGNLYPHFQRGSWDIKRLCCLIICHMSVVKILIAVKLVMN